MQSFFQAILYQPIFNLFVGLYTFIPDVGAVILILTAIVKLVLYPLTAKSIAAQKSMADLQPKIEALKKKYGKKEEQQQLAVETMQLYKEHKVNPLGSCLPLLIQLPIFLALYWVMQAGLASTNFDLLYSFVPNPGRINPVSVGLVDLSHAGGVESLVLAIFAGIAQWWQAKMMVRKQPPKAAGAGSKDESMMAAMNKQMLYFLPVITVVIGYRLPAGLSLYWLFSTLTTAIQQWFMFHKQSGTTPPPTSSNNQPPIIEGKIAS